MCPVWVNGRFLDETPSKKAEKWSPGLDRGKVLWGLCSCGEVIYEGDSVGMYGDHEHVICYTCWLSGAHEDHHLDSAGLKFPGVTLSN